MTILPHMSRHTQQIETAEFYYTKSRGIPMVRCRLAPNLAKSQDAHVLYMGAFEYTHASVEAGQCPNSVRQYINVQGGISGIWEVWPHLPKDPKFLEGLWIRYEVRHRKVPKFGRDGKERTEVYMDLRFLDIWKNQNMPS